MPREQRQPPLEREQAAQRFIVSVTSLLARLHLQYMKYSCNTVAIRSPFHLTNPSHPLDIILSPPSLRSALRPFPHPLSGFKNSHPPPTPSSPQPLPTSKPPSSPSISKPLKPPSQYIPFSQTRNTKYHPTRAGKHADIRSRPCFKPHLKRPPPLLTLSLISPLPPHIPHELTIRHENLNFPTFLPSFAKPTVHTKLHPEGTVVLAKVKARQANKHQASRVKAPKILFNNRSNGWTGCLMARNQRGMNFIKI